MEDKKSTNPGYIIASVLVLLMILVFVLASNKKNSSDAEKAAADSLALDSVVPASTIGNSSSKPAATKEVSNWTYSNEVDEMTDKKSYFAECTSLNVVNFDFPYEGGSTLSIVVRKSPKFGISVYLRISSGQFNVGIDGCTIRVRANGKRVRSLGCSEAADGSTDVIFIDSTSKFISLLKKSHSLKIEAPFFQYGYQVFSFEVKDLKWNH